MKPITQDVRHTLRLLAKSPGFTAAAIVCLALGIGATTAIFSIVNAVVMRPLPYHDPAQLVRIYSEFPTFPGGGLRRFWISPPEYLDLKRYAKSWQSIEAWTETGANFGGRDEPVRVQGAGVTGGLLHELGVSPAMGRLITPQDDIPGAPVVADISYGLWQRAFGGDPRIVGHETLLNNGKCIIIGVMPKGFEFPPGTAEPTDVWAPLQIDPAKPGGRGNHFLYLLGRLKPDVTLGAARDEMSMLVRQWGETGMHGGHNFDPKFHPIVMYGFHNEVVRTVRPAMFMLLVAVGFVLLIACVNVANLLLARAEARQREIAIRQAVGASVQRLFRQFLTEGIVLSLAGAVLGLLLAAFGLQMVKTTSAGSIPRIAGIGLDPTVLFFTLAVSVGTGLFFGLSPLLHVIAQNTHEALKASAGRTTATKGANRFRRTLVSAEVALSLVLLIGTGLMIRAFWKLQEVNPGFNPNGLLTMHMSLPDRPYADYKTQTPFWERLEAGMSALPGVVSATIVSGLPPQRPINANDTDIEGLVRTEGGPINNVDYWQATGDRYFETMGIRLMEGRFLDARDGASAPPAVVVNQTFVRHFYGNQDPIGKRVRVGSDDPWRTIVGVVEDVKNAGLDQPVGTELYFPFRQIGKMGFGLGSLNVVLRAKGDPAALIGPARRIVSEIDPSLPMAHVRTVDDVMLSAQARPRFLASLLTIFSVVALVLAAVGIYGVISYSVARRTAEFGIRMALGARPADVLLAVLRQGLGMGVAGIVAGFFAALVLTRLIRGLLFGINSFDPITVALMVALLLFVTLLACYVPARRATKIDPMLALREE